jgi:argininosuccinate lyase
VSRLWEKGDPLSAVAERFTVGRDPELDLALLPYDALGSAAHAVMLAKIGVLSDDELTSLLGELSAIASDARQGTMEIRRSDEDGHTAIENRLTERCGDAGRKVHTGRSRNDQVIAALRLWGREMVLALTGAVLDRAEQLVDLGQEHGSTVVPGYTHTRQAMPSTVGHLFAAHAEGLLDAVPWLETAFGHLDRSPLGSASGYGVGLPLDRRLVSDLLAFSRPQVNTLAVQNDRGKTEMLVLGAALGPVADLSRLATDLIWFSSEELGYVSLSVDVTTGSSIMPQKRNPDVLELARAGAARLRAQHAEAAAVFMPLASGYHRDLQLTKQPFVEGLQGALDLVRVFEPVLAGLTVHPERCRAALTTAIASTDEVYARVREGEAFRDAYRAVGAEPDAVREGADVSWRRREHLGAPGVVDEAHAERNRERIAAAREALGERAERVARAWNVLES